MRAALFFVILSADLLCISPLQGAQMLQSDWTVDGVARSALISVPENWDSKPCPVVFGFHGHGGSMKNAARSFRIHEVWPEALVVYMQGLNAPGQLTDAEGKRPGWQKEKGDQDDRDFKFFDAVLASLKKEYRVDEKRIYAMGHSNGGSFTYLLWHERPEVFAAFAPSGAAALRIRNKLNPKPVLHIAGQNDPLVKFSWQMSMIDAVKVLNHCGEGVPWQEKCTQYPSASGTPVVTYLTSQGHRFPADAPALIVRFFKEHPAPHDPDRG